MDLHLRMLDYSQSEMVWFHSKIPSVRLIVQDEIVLAEPDPMLLAEDYHRDGHMWKYVTDLMGTVCNVEMFDNRVQRAQDLVGMPVQCIVMGGFKYGRIVDARDNDIIWVDGVQPAVCFGDDGDMGALVMSLTNNITGAVTAYGVIAKADGSRRCMVALIGRTLSKAASHHFGGGELWVCSPRRR